MSKNSFETMSFGRGANASTRKVLAVEARLAVPNEDDVKNGKYGPMQEPQYSRFRLSLIEKTAEKTVVNTANIPAVCVDELTDAYKNATATRMQMRYAAPAVIRLFDSKYGKTMEILETLLKDKCPPAAKSAASEPYLQKFQFGSLKGKSIPDVLGDSPEKNLEIIKKQKEFLESNLPKFPANATMIKEIARAIAEVESGTYNASLPTASETTAKAETTSDTIVIYSSDKNFLKSKTDSAGNVFCYSVRLTCELNKDMPWLLTIANGYAPLEVEPSTKRELPQFSRITDKNVIQFRMNDAEASYFVNWMHKTRSDFLNVHYSAQLKKAQDIEKAAIAAAKK